MPERDRAPLEHVQVHVGAQPDRAGQEPAGGDDDPAAAGGAAGVDRGPERGGAVGGAVPFRAVRGHEDVARGEDGRLDPPENGRGGGPQVFDLCGGPFGSAWESKRVEAPARQDQTGQTTIDEQSSARQHFRHDKLTGQNPITSC